MSRVIRLSFAIWAMRIAIVLWDGLRRTSRRYRLFQPPTNLQRAKMFLAAGDFRRAVEACRQEVQEHPSVESYLYLTYVYQALDAYMESLAKADQWVAMEHLYLNLTSGGPEELLDPPNVLARMAKEMIQASARQQADVTSELATRLDPSAYGGDLAPANGLAESQTRGVVVYGSTGLGVVNR